MTALELKQGINKKIIQPIRLYKRRNRFKDRAMSIISANCIGGGICHDFGWRFLSPTINLFMMPADYLTFCENLDQCLTLPIVPKLSSGYPVGEMELPSGTKIEFHFVHYKTFEEANFKWKERCKRVDKNKILLLFTDQNGCTIDDIKRFDKLPYQKILFVGNEQYKSLYDYTVYVKPQKDEVKKGINPIDHCMWFIGLSGRRRYEHFFDMEGFFRKIKNEVR